MALTAPHEWLKDRMMIYIFFISPKKVPKTLLDLWKNLGQNIQRFMAMICNVQTELRVSNC